MGTTLQSHSQSHTEAMPGLPSLGEKRWAHPLPLTTIPPGAWYRYTPPCLCAQWHPSHGLICHPLTLAPRTGLAHGRQLSGPGPLPFSYINGVLSIVHDIKVHAETEVTRDHRLQAVLEWCEKINLTLNKEKCVFKVKQVTYIGHKLIQKGIKPDDEKVRAINDMPAPTDKKGEERLLGAVNYLGKFIPNLATVTEPIRVLLSMKGYWVSVVTWTRKSASRNQKHPN